MAAMKSLVLIARTNKHSCERLAAEIARNQFSTSEVGLIYDAPEMETHALQNRAEILREQIDFIFEIDIMFYFLVGGIAVYCFKYVRIDIELISALIFAG
jgi:hypothetical protein